MDYRLRAFGFLSPMHRPLQGIIIKDKKGNFCPRARLIIKIFQNKGGSNL